MRVCGNWIIFYADGGGHLEQLLRITELCKIFPRICDWAYPLRSPYFIPDVNNWYLQYLSFYANNHSDKTYEIFMSTQRKQSIYGKLFPLYLQFWSASLQSIFIGLHINVWWKAILRISPWLWRFIFWPRIIGDA